MSIFKTQKAKTIIVIAIFLAVWLWDVSFAYKYGESYLDTDMASEMILANESNQTECILIQIGFIPRRFVYSVR